MPQLFSLAASAFVVADVTPTSTVLSVEAGKADFFPVATSVGDWFKVAILDEDGGKPEICYVQSRAAGSNQLQLVSTSNRGKENGVAARSWLISKKAFVYQPLTNVDVAAALLAVGPRDALSSTATNFNSITTSGIYSVTGSGSWTGSTNAPTSASNPGLLQVFSQGSVVMQSYSEMAGKLWGRIYNGTAWSAWVCYGGPQSNVVFGTATAETIVARNAANTHGFARLMQGSPTYTGFVDFELPNTTRLGYIGYADGTTKIIPIQTENGGIYRFQGAAPRSTVAASHAEDLVRKQELDLGWTTGDVKQSFRKTAPAGWVFMRGLSIGSAASGATERANADTQALFEHLWTNDDELEIQDSAGATTTKGASAAADFAANKRIIVKSMVGAYGEGWDPAGARAMGNLKNSHVGNHQHEHTDIYIARPDGTPIGGIGTVVKNDSVQGGGGGGYVIAGRYTYGVLGGDGDPATYPKNRSLPWFIKL